MNVAVTSMAMPSFLTVFPAGVARPLASNLNFVAGQAPTPNAVTVDVPASGQVSFYNHEGTVNVVADIVGYYADHTHDDRYYTKPEVDGALSAKANSSDVYTKPEVDGALSGKANAPLVQTGTSSNDPFVNFLGAPLALDDYCADAEGCRITLIRELGGTRYLYEADHLPDRRKRVVDVCGRCWRQHGGRNEFERRNPEHPGQLIDDGMLPVGLGHLGKHR